MKSATLLGARALWRRPLAALASILCLALGLASTAVAMTLFDAAVFRPRGFAHAERLVVLWESDLSRGRPLSEVSLPDFEEWSRQSTSFTSMAAFGSSHWPGLARIGDGSTPVALRAVTRAFFSTLGVVPFRGRDIDASDLLPTVPPPVVLSHRFWVSNFAGADDIIGKPLFISGREYHVIGVMPADVSFPETPDVWVSAERELERVFAQEGMSPEQQRRLGVLEVLGRLKEGVPHDRARRELTGIAQAIHQRGDPKPTQWAVVVTPVTDVLLGALGPRIWIAMVMASAVLLFALANGAAVRAADIMERELELTARLFLGATRSRITRQLAAEPIPLIGLATAAALGLAAALLIWVDRLPVVADGGIALSRHVETTAMALVASSTLAWLLVGWVPASVSSARIRTTTLAASSRSVGQGTRSRAALVGLQVALAVCLVAVAAGAWRAFDRLSRLDVGFATHDVTVVDVTAPNWKLDTPESGQTLHRRLRLALDDLPGVEIVAGTSLRPFRFGAIADGLPVKRAEDADLAPSDALAASRVVATPQYFAALGVRLLEGREFTDDDRANSERVAVVSRTLARTLWGEQSAIGRRVDSYTLSTRWQSRVVVGVVDDVRSRGLERPALELYVPHTQTTSPIGSYVLRAQANRIPTEAMIRQALRSVEPDMGLDRVQTTGAIMRTALAPARVLATIAGLLGGVAVVLLGLGVFGAAASTLRSAWAEVAVRQAVGATPLRAARAPLGLLTRAVAIGLGLGLLASPGAVGALGSSGLAATDNVTVPLVVASVLVLLAAAVAVWPSLRRAMHVTPSELLRER